MPSGSDIREMFLRYFEQQKHKRVHSSSLVPANDPTLLFTNAGMNQFKDVFLGLEKRDYSRATTSQKCVRAGGKHNDLENVGFTNRHHTFFEMLGNFSFGDYFKEEAIKYAWELLTSPEWFKLDVSKMYFTIFGGAELSPPPNQVTVGLDTIARDAWLKVGAPKERVIALEGSKGVKELFWSMGETGPCGCCSEIHYDMGAAASDQNHTDCQFGCECGRYVEIWNLVFMQWDRDASGILNLLPKPSIDTGMGLERIAAVLQGKISNYDTDLFRPLIDRAVPLVMGSGFGQLPARALDNTLSAASFRIIADHSRAATFLISDGVIPSNERRGYVLRKIIRRAIRHGRLMGQNRPFLFEMVYAVTDLMSGAYPELRENADRTAAVIKAEETRFARTLEVGWRKMEEEFGLLVNEHSERLKEILRKHVPREKGLNTIAGLRMDIAELRQVGITLTFPGADAFRLYETYGLPKDFIEEACRDMGIAFDEGGFEHAMEEQREKARASWKGGTKAAASPAFRDLAKTAFEGYAQTESRDCEVLAIVKNGAGARELKPGEEGEVVLDHTPFYADSGGQVGDVGWFYDSSRAVVAEVRGCVAPVQGVRAHRVVARQPIAVGDKVTAVVDAEVRLATMRNHTATHLLHAALRETLGKHVKQAGSLVDPGHLRFDFSHFTAVADEELQDIEDLMNREVLKNEDVEVITDVPIDVAINEYKAMALFGEKYGDKVRVIRIGDFSTELCGGTHTLATGEIGLVKILSEGSVSSGVRRVEAVSGEGSLAHFRKDHALEHVVSSVVSRRDPATSPADALKSELERREAEIKRLTKELENARMKTASSSLSSAQENVREVNGIKVLAQRVDNVDRNQMRTLVDNLRNKLGSGVVVLGSAQDGKVALIVGVTKDLTGRVPAGKIVGAVAQKVGGSGGGRPDMAEAGGKDPSQLDAALASAYDVVKSLLS